MNVILLINMTINMMINDNQYEDKDLRIRSNNSDGKVEHHFMKRFWFSILLLSCQVRLLCFFVRYDLQLFVAGTTSTSAKQWQRLSLSLFFSSLLTCWYTNILFCLHAGTKVFIAYMLVHKYLILFSSQSIVHAGTREFFFSPCTVAFIDSFSLFLFLAHWDFLSFALSSSSLWHSSRSPLFTAYISCIFFAAM